MADTKNIDKLDNKLIETGLIEPNLHDDYKKVHTFLNSHVRKNGKILTEETFSKGDDELRNWLMVLYKKGASQEKLTSYLRVGLAHLCYNFVESSYKQISLDDLVTRALLSFKNRKFHKTFFKLSVSEAKTSVRGKKELRSKNKPIKKKKTISNKKNKKASPKKKADKKKLIKPSKTKKKISSKKKASKGFFARLFS
ncbi:MAG: hypothetical protein MH321_14700 [Leptospiraceae bacterium]|nr:hypothetical protein [Leptospiraceae bacterium]